MGRDTEPMPDASRANLKRRILNNLDEFPRAIELGTFRTEHLLIKLGHLLRELGRSLDRTRAEQIIYGPDSRSLQSLGDEYWELGMAIDEHRSRNRRKSVNRQTIATLEDSDL